MVQMRKLIPDEMTAGDGGHLQRAKGQNGRGDLGFEATLWLAADKLRGNLEAAEYKHVVLGLVFLKYVSDAFEQRQMDLTHAVQDPASDYYAKSEAGRQAVLENRDEYTAENVFWIPKEARWGFL